MPLVIPDGFLNAHWRFNLDGSTKTMSFANAYAHDGTSDAQAHADNLVTLFSSSSGWDKGEMASQWLIHSCYVEMNDGGTFSTGEGIANAHGTHGDLNILPPNSTYIVKKQTGLPGRNHRGRMYIPMLSTGEEDVDNNGRLSDTNYTTVGTRLVNFTSDAFTVDGALQHAVLLHETAETPTVIVSYALESLIATQRRRLR